jgi:hypothetical protein
MGLIEILLNRWIILIAGILLMLVGLKPEWTMAIVRMVGKMGWAENSVGRGGTFTIWKIIGILAPILAIIYFFSGGVQIDSQSTQNSTQYENSAYN